MSFAPPQPSDGSPPFSPVAAAAGATSPVVPLTESSALELTLRALRPILSRADVTELCINSPGEAFIETASGWSHTPLPFADYQWCLRLAKLVANATRQHDLDSLA
jgi:type IV secretion system protein VirB11